MDRTKYNYSSELEVELVKKNAVLCILVLFILTGCTTSEIEYETSRDEVIYSPSGNYSITLRYDYVSRPYIFKDDTLVFETNKPGYNETVYFKVEWESEDEIFLYIESDNDKYSNEKYFIKIYKNYICLFNYLFISSQMSAKPYFIGSTGILLLW